MDTKVQASREDRIRERAYLIWRRAGEPVGEDRAHWAKACEEIDEEDGQAATHNEPIASSALPTAEEFASPSQEPASSPANRASDSSPPPAAVRSRRKSASNGHVGAGV